MIYSDCFQLKARSNGESFICLKDDAPIEIKELIQSIHLELFNGCLPNDWVYQVIFEAFELLEVEKLENCNIEPDIYYGELHKWLVNPFAAEYCTEVMKEFGSFESFYDLVACAQAHVKSLIHYAVNDFIHEKEVCNE